MARAFRRLPLAAFIGLAVVAPCWAVSIATLDVDQVEAKSQNFKALNDRVGALVAELRSNIEARRAFKYLSDTDAQRAATLKGRELRREALNQRDRTELDALVAQDRQLGDEWIALSRVTQPSQQQRDRLQELFRWQTANRQAIATMEETANTSFQEGREKLAKLYEEQLGTCIERATRDVNAQICVVSTIPLLQPLLDGQTLAPSQVRVVHWGALDVTQRVTQLLDEVDLKRALEAAQASVEPAEARIVQVRGGDVDFRDGKDGDYRMRLVSAAGMALPLMLSALATAQAQTPQSVAFIDEYRIRQAARPFVETAQQLEALKSERSDEYIVNNGVLYLPDADAKRTVELQLKQMRDGQGLSDAERQELSTLLEKDRQNQSEYFMLVQRQNLTEDENRRLRELNDLLSARQDALQALAKKNMQEWTDKHDELMSGLQDKLRQAVEQACQATGATVCLTKWIITMEPLEDGNFQPAPLNIVHWGGTDITQAVIDILGTAPAANP